MTDQDRLRALEAENKEWRAQLGDGPPSYYAAGIELLKGDLSAWMMRADAAEARVQELERKVREQEVLLQVADAVAEQCAELKARVTVLEAALRRYGQHEAGCDAQFTDNPRLDGELDVCTCGFSTLLHPEGSPAPEGP